MENIIRTWLTDRLINWFIDWSLKPNDDSWCWASGVWLYHLINQCLEQSFRSMIHRSPITLSIIQSISWSQSTQLIRRSSDSQRLVHLKGFARSAGLLSNSAESNYRFSCDLSINCVNVIDHVKPGVCNEKFSQSSKAPLCSRHNSIWFVSLVIRVKIIDLQFNVKLFLSFSESEHCRTRYSAVYGHRDDEPVWCVRSMRRHLFK